jgi:CheY-like chemotaxis protein
MFAMRSVLAQDGFDVAACDLGSEALQILDRAAFDLVVVDTMLPDMTGVALCREVVEAYAIPVILRSTLAAGPADRVAALEAGADAYLVEPFDAEVLVATVRAVLRNRELRERLDLAVNMQGVGHWEWNIPGQVVSWTPSLEIMHGYAPGTFPGTLDAFFGCVHPDARERVKGELERAVNGTDDRFEIGYEFLRTDGTTGHLIGRARILRGADGQAVELIGVALDVSEGVVAARRNDQMVQYVEALMATSTLAQGRAVIRRRGPVLVGADLVDIEWTPAEDELDRGDVPARTILRRPELENVPTEGTSQYVSLDPTSPTTGDAGGSADGGGADDRSADGGGGHGRPARTEDLLRLVAVHRVTTPAGTGRLAVGWIDPPDLREQDRRFVELFAGLSISGLRQLSDYERHLHIGLTLQRALLPHLQPVRGLEVAVSYEPATEASLIGGDWYDVVEIRPGLAAVVIGDIAGHGITASAAASAARHTMRTALSAIDDVGAAMRLVDRLAAADPEHPTGTAALMLIDLATGEAEVVLAGHPPPLLRGSDGSTHFVEADPYPLLGFGLWADRTVETHRITLDPGQIVVFYTDGAVERRSRSLDAGLADLAKVVSGLGDPQEIVDVVVGRNDPALAALADDTIVLAVRLGD